MKFLDWASYVFLSSEEKSEFKKELRKRRYEREMAMFDRQNLAGGKIGLSLFRDAELEKKTQCDSRTWRQLLSH